MGPLKKLGLQKIWSAQNKKKQRDLDKMGPWKVGPSKNLAFKKWDLPKMVFSKDGVFQQWVLQISGPAKKCGLLKMGFFKKQVFQKWLIHELSLLKMGSAQNCTSKIKVFQNKERQKIWSSKKGVLNKWDLQKMGSEKIGMCTNEVLEKDVFQNSAFKKDLLQKWFFKNGSAPNGVFQKSGLQKSDLQKMGLQTMWLS